MVASWVEGMSFDNTCVYIDVVGIIHIRNQVLMSMIALLSKLVVC